MHNVSYDKSKLNYNLLQVAICVLIALCTIKVIHIDAHVDNLYDNDRVNVNAHVH